MKLQVMIIVRIAKRALATVPYGGCIELLLFMSTCASCRKNFYGTVCIYGGCIELLLFMSTCASCRKNSKVSSFYGTVKIATAYIISIISSIIIRIKLLLPS